MYGYDTLHINAMEGVGSNIKSWCNTILGWIRTQCEKIRGWMTGIKDSISNWLKSRKPSADEIKDASSKAPDIIKDIEYDVTELIKSCITNVYDLQIVYDNTTKAGFSRMYKNSGDGVITASLKASYNRHYSDLHTPGSSDKKFKWMDDMPIKFNNYGGTNGMDKLYEKENHLNQDDVLEYNIEKLIQEKNFEKNSKDAIALKDRLNTLNDMPLSYNALKTGYNTFKNLFSINKEFGTTWSEIIMMHDWATGKIKTYLQDVIDVYKIGVAATNALGKRLTHIRVANDEGKMVFNPRDKDAKYKKEKSLDINGARKHYGDNPFKYDGKEKRYKERLDKETDEFINKTRADTQKYYDVYKRTRDVRDEAVQRNAAKNRRDIKMSYNTDMVQENYIPNDPRVIERIRKNPDAARRVEMAYNVYKDKQRRLNKDKVQNQRKSLNPYK